MATMMQRALRLARFALAAAAVALIFGGSAGAAEAGKKKAKDKYHFTLANVKAKAGVEGKVAAEALGRIEAELKKAFATHPQMVADLSSAPDPETDPKGFVKWLKKKKIKGAYAVHVDLTMYAEEVEDAPTGDGNKRVVVRLELHMFGETMGERKMGFEGVGGSTVKQDVGKKVRPRDREFTLQSAIEMAVADAMAESLRKLALPPAKPKK
jgi:hypothetical protein